MKECGPSCGAAETCTHSGNCAEDRRDPTSAVLGVSLRMVWKNLLVLLREGEPDPEDVVIPRFALFHVDMLSTSPLYLAVSRHGCASPRWLLQEFHLFLREGVLGSLSTFCDRVFIADCDCLRLGRSVHAATSSSSQRRRRRLRSVHRQCSLSASEWGS